MQKLLFFLLVQFIAVLPLYLCADDIVHTVKKNETLYGIAREYNISLDALVKANGIQDPKSLRVGMTLKIPLAYIVKKGDTLFRIARDYGTTVSALVEYNNLKADTIIKPGDIIRLPGGKREDIEAGAASVSAAVSAGSGEGDKSGEVSSDGTQAGTKAGSETPAAGGTPDAAGAEAKTVSAESLSQGIDPQWPLKGERIASNGNFSGARIAGSRGDAIFAVNSGRVIWEGPYRGFGRVIIIESGNDYIYVYGGNETSLVKVGDEITPRMEIARLGNNPHEGRAVLYFSVFKDGKPINPEKAPRGL